MQQLGPGAGSARRPRRECCAGGRDRTVTVGDTYTSIGKLQVSNWFSVPFPLAAMATWDKSKDLDSARTLRSLDPALLAFGHGQPLRTPAAAMDEAIARSLRKVG